MIHIREMFQKRIIEQSTFDILEMARNKAEKESNIYVTPEHVLYQIEASGFLSDVLMANRLSSFFFRERLNSFLNSLQSANVSNIYPIKVSDNLRLAIDYAFNFADLQGDSIIKVPHLLFGIAQLKDSLAGYLLTNNSTILKELV